MRHSIFFYWVLCFLMPTESCTDRSNADFKRVKYEVETIKAQTEALFNQTRSDYWEIERDSKNPTTSFSVKHFKPVIDEVNLLSREINKYLDSIRRIMDVDLNNPSQKLFNKKSVKRIFEEDNQSDTLFHRINSYSKNILSKDSLLYKALNKSYILPDSDSQNTFTAPTFYASFFKRKNLLEAYLNILLLQSNIVNFEGQVIRFYRNRYTNHEPYYNTFSLIVGQSSSIVKVGEELTVTAGVGSFSTKANPVFIINGDTVKMDGSGAAVKSLKAPKSPGKYSIPVYIKFTGQDSVVNERQFKISYEVVD